MPALGLAPNGAKVQSQGLLAPGIIIVIETPLSSAPNGAAVHYSKSGSYFRPVPQSFVAAADSGAATVNQAELQRLTVESILDAMALIAEKRWEFAYYASGYAVECALKSCVLARMIHTGWIFREETKDVRDCRTHDFAKLIKLAGLHDELNLRPKESTQRTDRFVENWGIAATWSVDSRYRPTSESEASKLFNAIAEEPHGVLKWIQNYW